MDVTTFDGPVELTLPADSRLLRLVRLMASGLASTAGFDVEELDDLRIAVDEAVAALLEGGDGSRLALQFDLSSDRMIVTGSVPTGAEPLDPDRLELSTMLLGAVCDEHRVEVTDGKVLVSITKRRAS